MAAGEWLGPKNDDRHMTIATGSQPSTSNVATNTEPAERIAAPFACHSTMPQPLPSNGANRSRARKLEVELVTNWENLVHESSCWDELAGTAIEPNIFYSSFAVLAAMRHLNPPGEPESLIVRGIDISCPKAATVWCGFFPLMKAPTISVHSGQQPVLSQARLLFPLCPVDP